ncbi:MAG TPA: cupin domain-containing protein [Streptosporangiaceae bacterium]|nr:cupin domain-containing protein [Streptosporangiaceae bacterium]
MTGIMIKNFSAADETRTPDKTRVETVGLGAVTAARFTLQPGWRWSQCIKPVAGTDTCQARHVGAVVSGRLHVSHADGTDGDLGPGDAYVLEPGHDAWVSGDEPFVGYEFEGTTAGSYAKPAA